MANRDTYRSLSTEKLLERAREEGIDPEMAVVLAERLECGDCGDCGSMGGRYFFNQRSEYA